MSQSGRRHRTAISRGISLALYSAALLLTAGTPALAQHALTHHMRPAVGPGPAKIVRPMAAAQSLRLDIVLPLRDQAGLEKFLQELYDPSSPAYRHFLTVPEFTARFGPAQEDYDALIRYVASYGFHVVGGSIDGSDLQVEGPVSTIEAAFRVKMGVYRHPRENRTFYAPDREPTVDLPFPLWHISGLDDYSIPHPMLSRKSDPSQAGGFAPRSVQSQAVTGSGPSGSFLGSDMRAAYYGGTTLTGAGQNIGLLEFWGTNLADLNTYFANVGQTNHVPITLLSTDGTIVNCASSCDDTEQTIDMTQAIGMAPGLSSLVMYIGSSDTAIMSAMTTHVPLPSTIGCSWGWDPADPQTLNPYFLRMAAQGQNFFAASGDTSTWSGYWAWPADSAYIVSVGGTDLSTTSAGGAWASETTWADSGGGPAVSDGIPIPSWQQIPGVINSSNNGSKTYRNGPDVAANANFSFYVCADQTACTANVYGGTSFSAPMWAAYMALANQQAVMNGNAPIGFINPAVYSFGVGSSYSTLFHDVTSGTSGSYSAVPGFDLVTGWGSPNGAALINALAAISASSNFTISASPGSVSVGQGGSGTSTIMTTVSGGYNSAVVLAASGQPAGVTVNFSPALIAAPGAGASTMTMTASPDATPGTYTITVTGTGASTIQPVTTVVLTLKGTPAFSIAPSPGSVSVTQGGSGTTTITTASVNGLNASIALSASGLPAGAAVTFSPASIAAPGSGSSTLTFNVASSTPGGTYPVVVTGTGGGLQISTTVFLTVAVPAFTVGDSPASLSVSEGSGGTSTITTAVSGGFNSSIALSATGQPAGVTVSFSSASIAAPGSGTSTMSISVAWTTAPGTYTIIVTGTGGGITHSAPVTLTVLSAITIITASLPNALTGVPYSATMTAVGGTAPYTWALTSRRIPLGLTLNPQTGLISGTAVTPANATLTFSVTDSTIPTPQASTATLSLSVTSAPFTITTTSLPNGQTGMPYAATLGATNGTMPYIWQLVSGALPSGLTLNPFTGLMSGTPTASATNTQLTFKVTDSTTPAAQTALVNLTLTVTSISLVITTAALPGGQLGMPYSAQLGAGGGLTPYTWQLSSGALPAGLTLNTLTGQVGGTPTATVTNTPLTFKVTDSTTPVPLSATVSLTLTIASSAVPLTITTISLPGGQTGIPYSALLAASGGSTPYSWQLVSGALPAGLIFNPLAGQINGTPTASVTNAPLTFKVTDSSQPVAQTATVNLTLTIVSSPATLSILTTSLPDGQLGVSYSAALTAAGGVMPYSWQLASGRMPPGLTLNPQTGQISGTPISTLANTFLRFVVTDSTMPAAQMAATTLSLTVSSILAPTTLTITTASLPNGQPGVPYSALLAATGGSMPYSWQLVSGTLPAGLTLNGQTGLISGTPAGIGTSPPMTFKVTDSTTPAPQTATVSLTIIVTSAPTMLTITTTKLPDGITGVPYSATLAAIGGTMPYTWALASGRMPFGLTLNPQTGQISGTPFASQSNAILTFRVTDSSNPATQTATVSLVLNIL